MNNIFNKCSESDLTNEIVGYRFFNARSNSSKSVMQDFAYTRKTHPNNSKKRRCIVRCEKSNRYYVFVSPEEFEMWLSIGDERQYKRHCHEVILDGRQRMRFDIDVSYNFSKYIKNKKIILEEILRGVERGFDRLIRTRLMREFDYSELVVMENHREGKYSWHVVMPEVWMANSRSCLYFAKKVKELISDKTIAEYLDLQVYKKMQCFRMEGHGKVGQEGVLKQTDFEVKGKTYTNRVEWKDTLISWYDEDTTKHVVNLEWEERREEEEKKMREIEVVNKMGGGYNATPEILDRVLGLVDPNEFEGKGGEWRWFSRVVYDMFVDGGNKEEVKNKWMEWCEGYYRNNERENEGLWKSFKKKSKKRKCGLPTLKKLLDKFGKEGKSKEIAEILCLLNCDDSGGDRKTFQYPLAGSVVEMKMSGDWVMKYELSERGVEKLVRLNKNRPLSLYYVSAMKAAAGGGYILKSMLEKYYDLSEKDKEFVHEVKPSVKNFYAIMKATVVANKREFDRVESAVADVYGKFDKLRGVYEIKKNTAEEVIEKVVNVDSMRFVDNETMDYEVVYIKSPTGTGKTQAMVKWLRDNPGKTCCMVTQRVALADDLYGHYQECGFEHYKYCDDIRGAGRLIVQVESLHRLKSENMNEYDVLLLDESESLVTQFLSKNIKKVHETRAVIEWLMMYSGQIVCMDAYMSKDTVEMVREFTGGEREEVMYVNETKTERETRVDVMQYYEEMVSGIMAAVGRKKKVVVVAGSIKKSREIFKLVTCKPNEEYFGRKIKAALYNSDHLKEYWDDLKDVNKNWVKYDVIIYTSSIETGISFTEEHFDELYAYFTPETTNYKSALQMLKRVRNLKDGKMSIYVKPKKYVPVDKFEEGDYDQIWEYTVGDFLESIPQRLDRTGKVIYPYKGPFYKLAMINYRKEVESRSDYFNLLFSELERVGCYVSMTKDRYRTPDDIVKRRAVPAHYDGMKNNVLKFIGMAVEKEEVEDIKNADVGMLKNGNGDGGKEEKDAKMQEAIKKCLEVEGKLTDAQIIKYKDEGTRRKFYNMKELYERKGKEYMNLMKKYHIDKVKRNNGNLQTDLVMRANNSLQCLLAYEVVMKKLWPEIYDKPFSLDLLEKAPLSIVDVERFRENSQRDIDKISGVFGIPKYRMITDIKNQKKYTNKKIINMINVILGNSYDLKLVWDRDRSNIIYKISHEHPKELLNISGDDNFDDENFRNL